MSWTKISPKVRTRFAPSPTGYLHVGGARTALYNYLYAKKMGGEFILRVEDTDEARSTDESLRMMISDLKWLDLMWDEGVDPDTLKDMGPCAPYRQSQRREIYRGIAEKFLDEGKAYYCFLTDAELEQQRSAAMAAGRPPHVNSPYADWTLAQAREKMAAGATAVVRFKTKHLKKDYVIQDLIRGEVKFPSDMVGDFVLLRSGGMPVYNFCCVVDDHLMKITHVLRAEEHLSNTLRQLMIYEGMGWQTPEFGHISLVLDDDRQKLSKRKGAVACDQFKNEGYLPDAIKNFIALLGWSHPEGKEVMSPLEMQTAFSLDRVHAAGAVFDRVKLKWMNAMHLRSLPDAKLWEMTEPFLKAAGVAYPHDPVWQGRSIEVFKTSMETLADAVPLYKLLDDRAFEIAPEAAEVYGWGEPTKATLAAWREQVTAHPREDFTADEFLKMQDEVKAKAGVKGKNLFMPIRVAVIGKPHGTELKTLVPLMKKASLMKRAEAALAKA